MAQATQTGVSVDNLDALPDDNVAKDGEEGEDCWKGGLAVDDEKGDVVDFQAIGEIANSGTALVGVGDYDDFVTAVYEFLEGCV